MKIPSPEVIQNKSGLKLKNRSDEPVCLNMSFAIARICRIKVKFSSDDLMTKSNYLTNKNLKYINEIFCIL